MSASAGARERAEVRTGATLWAALGAALLLASLKVPPLGLVLAPVSPVPLMVLRLKAGAGAAALGALLAAALVSIGLSPRLGLAFLLVLAGPALLLVEAVARGRGLRRGCAWAFGLLAAQVGLSLLAAGDRMAAFWFYEPLEQLRAPAFLGEMRDGGLRQEQVESWVELSRRTQAMMQVVYPAAFLIMAALLVLAHAAALRAYLARRDPGWLEGGEFETLRWPLGAAVAFVAAGSAVTLPLLRPTAYNVLLVLAFFFALQGLAVVVFFTRRLAAPAFLRAAVLVLVLLNPWASYVLPLLGLFDIWVDFRKWAQPPPAEGG